MATIRENPLPLPERGLVRIQPGAAKTRETQSGGCADTVKKLVMEVDSMQKDADGKVQDFATGKVTDIHEVTIAAEQSRLAFSLLLQVRNKLLDAYHEVMRTQV